jgi:hypothetical protein
MKQWFRHPAVPLVLGAFSILLLVLLAAGIESLDFKQGEPFSYVEPEEEGSGVPAEPVDLGFLAIVSVVIFAIFIVIALIAASPKQRRRILLILLLFGLSLLLIMWWLSRGGENNTLIPPPTPTMLHTPQAGEAPAPVMTEVPAVVYEPPPVSPWISIGITFIVLLLVALLVWLAVRYRLRDIAPLDTLAEIAGQAVGDLQAGKDYGDTILNCYANMAVAVEKGRGIRRRGNLTPAEFVAVLERARLPSTAVRRLTALFERVRYGSKKASVQEIEEAISCLKGISSAIRETQ